MANKVLLSVLLLFAFACGPSVQQASRPRPGGYRPEEGPPRPFQFSYNARDELGSTNYHDSQGDGTGTVKGTYGYTDPDGLFRVVEYVADLNGYRATVRTNEPGVEEKHPADVVMYVQPVPQAVLSKYARLGR